MNKDEFKPIIHYFKSSFGEQRDHIKQSESKNPQEIHIHYFKSSFGEQRKNKK